MKQVYMILMVMLGCSVYAEEYKSVTVYGAALYKLLTLYVESNPTCDAASVETYLDSSASQVIYRQAQSMGYSRQRVIKSCHCTALAVTPQKDIIIQGLRDSLKTYNMRKEVLYWYTIGCASFASLMSLYAGGFFLYYFKRDRRVIEHYIQNRMGGFFPPLH